MPSFVSFIPTEPDFVFAFFELAPVSEKDVVYDLGCGDGRLLFTALERGAGGAVGIDIDPKRIEEAANEVKKRGLEEKITLVLGDVLNVDLSYATVVFCYLIGEASAALKPKFEAELKPGTRVVMEMFPVPYWKPNKTYVVTHGMDTGYREFYLYVMPPAYSD